VSKHTEGEPRPGPWYLPITGGWLPVDVGKYTNWWQLGYDPLTGGTGSAIVEACVSAYYQTIAMCPGGHWRKRSDGGRERVKGSPLDKILRRPNDYQTVSDFLLNMTRSLYLTGNAYAIALEDERFEIDSLHLMDSRRSSPLLADTGEIFYSLGGNEVISRRVGQGNVLVPARRVLHVKLHTNRSPLKGETPLASAAMDVAASGAMTAQQFAFYTNQSRPSQVLSTDTVLNKEQLFQLRDAWNEQSKGLNQGGVPILAGGLKPVSLGTTAHDAQLAEMLKLTEQHIALAYRVPIAILGIAGNTTSSSEAMMQSWIASGLGFALNHIEEAFGALFGLAGQPEEYLELSTSSLLRSARKDRIEALVKGVQGGIYSPDEAREEEELPEVPGGYGKEPRVQQQVVPLSAAAAIPAAPAPPPSPPAGGTGEEDEEKSAEETEHIRLLFRTSHGRHLSLSS
jgi:HK97 family phage portal protein